MIRFRFARLLGGIALAICVAGVVRELGVRLGLGQGEITPRSFSGRWTGMAYAPRAVAAPVARRQLLSLAAAIAPLRGGSATDGEQRLDVLQKTLDRCVELQPADMRCWSNLAAVRLEAARLQNDPRGAVDAFGAADRAARLAPTFPEALFNRAAALEALNLERPATEAWKRYLAVDGASEWADEARDRLSSLRHPTKARLWESAKPRLEKAAAANDAATVREIVAEFPQEARTHAEWYFLSEWAAAMQAGDAARAAERLALAREIGEALVVTNGERLLADAVASIDHASASAKARLIEAHQLYDRARDAYSDRRTADARPLFDRSAAAFREAGSPMSRMADYYAASAVCDGGEIARSRSMIDAQLQAAPATYGALRGQLLWGRGTAAIRAGLIYEARDAYGAALAVFDRSGEKINTDFMRNAVSALDAETGRASEAWQIRLLGFRDASRGGDPLVMQSALYLAARAEAVAGRWDTAASLYGLGLEPGVEASNRALSADVAIWFTLAAHRVGWSEVGRRALDAARDSVSRIKDPSIQAASGGRLRVAEAILLTDADPRRAVELLTVNIEEANAGRGDRLELPETYLQRGRAFGKLHRDAEAEGDFRNTLALLEERERGGTADEVRESYFATGDSATDELVDLLERQGRAEEALVAADRIRTRAFGRPSVLDARDLRRLPAGTLLLHLIALPDRLLIGAAGADGVELRRVPVRRRDLKRAIDGFREAIVAGDEPQFRERARRLYDLVLAPVQERVARTPALVIVADPTVAALPFAALRDALGEYLFESHTILMAPSAAAFVDSAGSATATAATNALVVGNPAFDGAVFPHLPLLPVAGEVAARVAAEYRDPLLLTGAEATKQRVVAAMAGRGVIDLACHAILDGRDPARSVLLLAPSADDSGSLYLRDVARMKLSSPIVVLAGCRTAAAVDGTPPVLGSFTKAFLAAGSRAVVGTLWDVQDESAGDLSRLFHRNLASGEGAAEALRQAQRTMLHSGSDRRRAPLAWAAFQVHGSTF
jgi:CHAT domain-containing protein